MRGSEAHDAISWDADAGEYRRESSRAGGIEGGMTTGDLLVARVAMKPLATLNRPVLKTVDVETKEETVSFKERTDVTAVPAAGVVAETMVALVLASEALRKFGGDSLAEFVRNHDAYRAIAAMSDGVRHLVLVGLMGAGKTTVGRRCAARLGRAFVDTDDLVVDAAPACRSTRSGANGGEAALPRGRARGRGRRVRVAGAARHRVRRRNRGRPREPSPAACGRHRRVAARAHRGARRARRRRCHAARCCAGDPAGALAPARRRARRSRTTPAADAIVDTDDRPVDAVAAAVLDAFEGATS